MALYYDDSRRDFGEFKYLLSEMRRFYHHRSCRLDTDYAYQI